MTRRDLALSLLQDAGERGVTTGEFLDAGVGSRYSARILELRERGYSIISERIRDGSWRYTLEYPDEVGVEAIPDSPGDGLDSGGVCETPPGAARLFELRDAA